MKKFSTLFFLFSAPIKKKISIGGDLRKKFLLIERGERERGENLNLYLCYFGMEKKTHMRK
jgi:hypothetical protein